MSISKYYGPPGTGKTTMLISKVKEELDNGADIKDIGYLGFTRASSEEALSRALKYGITGRDNWFRTIHSACLYLMKSNQLNSDVVSYKHKIDFCKKNDLHFSIDSEDVEYGEDIPSGNSFFNTESYIHNAKIPMEEWRDTPHAMELEMVNKDFIDIFNKWDDYKFNNGLIDYNDMLKSVIDLKLNIPPRILFVDEFQDVSPLQYDVLKHFMRNKIRIYIGGDDDQAIYRFQGATPEIFLDVVSSDVHILPKSYRLRKEILDMSQQFIRLNNIRMEKEFLPRDTGGLVSIVDHPKPWEIPRYIMSGRTFILFRTNKMVQRFGWAMSKAGKLYKYLDESKESNWGWNQDKMNMYRNACKSYNPTQYLQKMVSANAINKTTCTFLTGYIESNVSVFSPDNIQTYMGTIHSAKGREADTVILFDDITNKIVKSLDESQISVEDERRVFYVGMTRAKERLVIIHNGFRDNPSFEIPKQLGLEMIHNDA